MVQRLQPDTKSLWRRGLWAAGVASTPSEVLPSRGWPPGRAGREALGSDASLAEHRIAGRKPLGLRSRHRMCAAWAEGRRLRAGRCHCVQTRKRVAGPCWLSCLCGTEPL